MQQRFRSRASHRLALQSMRLKLSQTLFEFDYDRAISQQFVRIAGV